MVAERRNVLRKMKGRGVLTVAFRSNSTVRKAASGGKGSGGTTGLKNAILTKIALCSVSSCPPTQRRFP